MTNLSVPVRPQIGDTLAGARGAAASLAALASTLADAAADAPADAPPSDLRHAAGALQVQAQRAALACMSLAAHAGRLEAFAHVAAVEAERRAAEREHERERVEAEAATDAGNYVREGETQEPHAYAAEAFAAWASDEGGAEAFAPLGEDEARAAYVAAFVRGVKGGAS